MMPILKNLDKDPEEVVSELVEGIINHVGRGLKIFGFGSFWREDWTDYSDIDILVVDNTLKTEDERTLLVEELFEFHIMFLTKYGLKFHIAVVENEVAWVKRLKKLPGKPKPNDLTQLHSVPNVE